MISQSINRVNQARDSKVQSLAFILMVSIIFAHGVFFKQQWLLIGAGLAFVQFWQAWSGLLLRRRSKSETLVKRDTAGTIFLTDGLFLGLIGLSLLGLYHPVKSSEGWMDAQRWFTLWMVYRQARWIQGEADQQRMLKWIKGAGVVLVIFAWLPQINLWTQGRGIFFMGIERLSSSVGYPNALGAFLAAVLLLSPRWRIPQILMFLTLLNTGSRASVVLCLLIIAGREIVKRRRRGQKYWGPFIGIRSKISEKGHKEKGLFWGGLLISASLFTLIYLKGPSQHLLNWRIENSLGERLLYLLDGLKLAWLQKGIPQAGGWLSFPLVQRIPYWTTDPHSLLIRVLLDQGIFGVLIFSVWAIIIMKQIICVLNFPNPSRAMEGQDQEFYVLSALLFLILHALMDADFLFGTLGILFWTLLGMSLPYEKKRWMEFNVSSLYLKKAKNMIYRFLPVYHNFNLKNLWVGLIYLFLGLTLLGAGVYSSWMNTRNSVEQEIKAVGNKQQILSILTKSLNRDQTQLSVRRKIASLELELQGANGLGAMETVLAWDKFNIRTYEWAQGLVLEEAERRRGSNPKEADILYEWSKELPSRFKKLSSVNPFERTLWPGAANFQPSEMMTLLASTAEERQLTLR